MVPLLLLYLVLQVRAKSINRNETDYRLGTSDIIPRKFRQTIISAIIKGHTANENQNPFFVRLVYRHGKNRSKFEERRCGGVVIARHWVLTAASCVYDVTDKERTILGQVGQYSTDEILGQHNRFSFSKIIIPAGFDPTTNFRDIALLKLRRQMPISSSRVLNLCEIDGLYAGEVLSTCGLGTTMPDHLHHPSSLNQMGLFRASFISSTNTPSGLHRCREDQICTTPVENGANTCFGDEGSPLFTFQCGSTNPDCVLGIANNYNWEAVRSKTSTSNQNSFTFPNCSRGSFFTSVPYMYDWITHQIARELFTK
ncbi:chymotrypsinogen A-like [Convolutriloba macropyga]|uniref:chymotrypsinogen A-like n=1 Tax=Convolutriloba macropyga TaxID=536237 RepID=UPI003F51F823